MILKGIRIGITKKNCKKKNELELNEKELQGIGAELELTPAQYVQ